MQARNSTELFFHTFATSAAVGCLFACNLGGDLLPQELSEGTSTGQGASDGPSEGASDGPSDGSSEGPSDGSSTGDAGERSTSAEPREAEPTASPEYIGLFFLAGETFEVGERFVYFCHDGKFHAFPKDGPGAQWGGRIYDALDEEHRCHSVAVAGSYAYVAAGLYSTHPRILRYQPPARDPVVVVDDLSFPATLALSENEIFWTVDDRGDGLPGVKRTPLPGGVGTAVDGIDHYLSMLVTTGDPAGDLFYFKPADGPPELDSTLLMRAPLDGGRRPFPIASAGRPEGLALATSPLSGSSVVWGDAGYVELEDGSGRGTLAIRAADILGNNKRVLGEFVTPISTKATRARRRPRDELSAQIRVDGEYVYWVVQGPTVPPSIGVYRRHVDAVGPVERMLESVGAGAIAVDDTHLYYTTSSGLFRVRKPRG